MNYSVVAEKFGLPKSKTEKFIKAAFAQIKNDVMTNGHCWVGRDVYFKKIEKPERPFRNPRTGERGIAPAKTLIVLRKQVV